MAEAKKSTTKKKTTTKKTTATKAVKKTAAKTPEAKGESKSTFGGKYHYANGKRKTSVARVRLYEKGKGDIIINDKNIEEFCAVYTDKQVIKSPLKLTGHQKTFDVSVKVVGGGTSGQAQAVSHGIAKALVEFDPELRPTLKKAGMLTRDSRVKERKKYGLKRARRAPQWAKR